VVALSRASKHLIVSLQLAHDRDGSTAARHDSQACSRNREAMTVAEAPRDTTQSSPYKHIVIVKRVLGVRHTSSATQSHSRSAFELVRLGYSTDTRPPQRFPVARACAKQQGSLISTRHTHDDLDQSMQLQERGQRALAGNPQGMQACLGATLSLR
jgi:hypothetical protein